MSEKKTDPYLERLLRAGSALSNAAYNLSRAGFMTAHDVLSLSQAYREWDDALSEFRKQEHSNE